MIVYNDQFMPLRKNHSNAIPRNLLVVKCETNRSTYDTNCFRQEHTFRLATAISARIRGESPENCRIHRLNTHESIWRLICEKTSANQTTWIVCHNALFQFIVSGLAERFETGEMTIDWPRARRSELNKEQSVTSSPGVCVIETPPTIIACRVGKTQGRVVIADILNWFPDGIQSLHRQRGQDQICEPKQSDSDEAWFDYCENECKTVFWSFCTLFKWVRDNDFGMFRYTAPSQSMAAFRHRFMDEKIYFHQQWKAKSLERLACFGGRLDVRKLGLSTGNFHLLDVCSLFPSVMSTGYFPVALNRFSPADSYNSVLPKIEWNNSIAEVELCTERSIYPLRLPNRVAYPIGQFRTVLCGEELMEAAQAREIVACRSWSEYRCRPIFGRFVETLWNLRQVYKSEGNFVYDQFTKRMMNSLYGKFAQMSPKWINLPDELAALPWSRWTTRSKVSNCSTNYRSFGWTVQKDCGKQEMANTFPAISAFITAAARMAMNRLRSICGGRHFYYQAVDSLIVDDDGLSRLAESQCIATNTLGKLRHQYTSDQIMVYGPNDYRIGDKIVRAGCSFEGTPIEDDLTISRRFLTKELLFHNQAPNSVIEEVISFARRLGYEYGHVDDDGWVSPLDASSLPSACSGDNPQAAVPAEATISTCVT